MRRLLRSSSWACVLVAAGTCGAVGASAQVTTFAPSATISAGLDDNVLWAPLGAPDTVWTVTPGFGVRREGTRATWIANYSFDTQRYQTHQELTTALARQTAHAEGKMLLSSQSTLTVSGDFDSSTTPFDLNTVTGLTTSGRIDVWRRDIGSEYTHAFGPASSVDIVYQLRGDFESGGDTIRTNAVQATFLHQFSGRHTWIVKGIANDYRFVGLEPSQPTQSYGVLLGWKEKITPLTTLTIAAGPRRDSTSMSLHPEIQAVLDRTVGAAVNVTAAYAQTSTTAVGVVGLISLKSFFATGEMHLPGDLDATLQGGTFFNAFGGEQTSAFRVGAEVAKHLKGAVTLAVSYASDVQKGLIGLPGVVVLPPAGPGGSVDVVPIVPGQTVIRRNVVLLRLTIAPDIRPRRPPTPEGSK